MRETAFSKFSRSARPPALRRAVLSAAATAVDCDNKSAGSCDFVSVSLEVAKRSALRWARDAVTDDGTAAVAAAADGKKAGASALSAGASFFLLLAASSSRFFFSSRLRTFSASFAFILASFSSISLLACAAVPAEAAAGPVGAAPKGDTAVDAALVVALLRVQGTPLCALLLLLVAALEAAAAAPPPKG